MPAPAARMLVVQASCSAGLVGNVKKLWPARRVFEQKGAQQTEGILKGADEEINKIIKAVISTDILFRDLDPQNGNSASAHVRWTLNSVT